MDEYIIIGDVHARPTELEECQNLLGLWLKVKGEHPNAIPLFLGDQFDTNDVMSVRVMEWWRHAALSLCPDYSPVCEDDRSVRPYFIVGNHDQVYPGTRESAMSSCRDVAWVVDEIERVGPLLMVGYCGDHEEFRRRTTQPGCQQPTLICHQDLAGFLYDDATTISRSTLRPDDRFVQVISGHLHVPQEQGRIWYPGSPRWRSRRDASVAERAVWWVQFSEDGRIARRVPYSTNEVCRRVVAATDSADRPAELVGGADNRVTIRGSVEYVARRRRELIERGAVVTAVPDRQAMVQVRESEGVDASMAAFLDRFSPAGGTSPARLRELLRDRVNINA